MEVHTTTLDGVFTFAPKPHVDNRGFFTRTFDVDVFRQIGVDPDDFVQDSQSRSRKGVVRGLHLRRGSGEAKLVRCSYGAVVDVVVDLRPGSATYLRHEMFELDDRTHRSVYIPRGCAHGFQALTDPADVCYRIDAVHDPSEDVAIRYDDVQIGVEWPLEAEMLSARDLTAPSFAEVVHLLG